MNFLVFVPNTQQTVDIGTSFLYSYSLIWTRINLNYHWKWNSSVHKQSINFFVRKADETSYGFEFIWLNHTKRLSSHLGLIFFDRMPITLYNINKSKSTVNYIKHAHKQCLGSNFIPSDINKQIYSSNLMQKTTKSILY